MKISASILIIVFTCSIGYAQIDAGLLLGLINVTTTEMNSISGPYTGSILYNTTENAIHQFNGSAWVNVATTGTNLATENLTQDAETRTYDMNSQNLGLINGKVGVSTNTPNSSLHVSGSLSSAIRTTSSNTTLDDNDFTLIMNTTKDLIISLPAANTCVGRIYILKNNGSGDNFTNIDYLKENGDPENKLTKDRIIWLQSDGTNWHQIIKD